MSLPVLKKDTDTASGNVCLFFTGPYCGVCKMIKPGLEKAAAAASDQVKVYEVDAFVADNQPLVAQYGVKNLPTAVVLRDGAPVATLVGGGQVSMPKILQALA